jgi:hypothetical protein
LRARAAGCGLSAPHIGVAITNLRNGEGTNETTGKKTFNTDVEIRAEPSDGVVRSNLWEKSMSDKELNTPMNREQLNTPRELTSEELDIVTGGATIGSGPQDGNNQGENNQVCTTSVGREQSAPSVSEIIVTQQL